jgi:hypothetical protein
MVTLDLESPPDLDGTLLPTHIWTDGRANRLLRALEDRFGAPPDAAAVREARTFADIVDAVQHRRGER